MLSAESIDKVLEPSIAIAPLASISNPAEFISTVCPDPFNKRVPPVDVTVTPPAPANVNAPPEAVSYTHLTLPTTPYV